MIIGLLIFAIAVMPVVLAVTISGIYKESKLTPTIYVFMISITVWQLCVGVLYLESILSEDTVLFLVRLLRIGPTSFVPIVFYLICRIIEDQPTMVEDNKWLKKIPTFILTKKYLYFLIGWSALVYVINWTSLGIVGLDVSNIKSSTNNFYFPIYGPLSWMFFLHMGSLLIYLVLAFSISKKVLNRDIGNFLGKISIYSMILFFVGLFNFLPRTGIFMSSIGVLMYSTMIMIEFVKINTTTKSNYYNLMERQKKLDYTGSLTASLIHEVQNTNQIVKGFSKMLNKDNSLTEKSRSSAEMILKSSEHLGDLADNYKSYMKDSHMSLRLDDLVVTINDAIEMSRENIDKHNVEIEFINHYNPLKAFINKTYIEQVFINLIKNSVEEISENSEEKKITITTDIIDGNIIINFRDTGGGIPLNNWENVFNPFMSFKENGMGLGLPFVKKTIIEHLGNVNIIESDSKGTLIQIELPQNGLLDLY